MWWAGNENSRRFVTCPAKFNADEHNRWTLPSQHPRRVHLLLKVAFSGAVVADCILFSYLYRIRWNRLWVQHEKTISKSGACLVVLRETPALLCYLKNTQSMTVHFEVINEWWDHFHIHRNHLRVRFDPREFRRLGASCPCVCVASLFQSKGINSRALM